MDRTPPKILIVAGEESGDMRAAPLVRAIHHYAPNIQFIGIGGDRSRQAGVKTFADITELAVIGFIEVLKNYGRIKKVFDLTVAKIRDEKPQAVILVDYPGFNLRLAREAKKLNVKVIYYVSPQVWAWKASRVKLIKQVVDRMIVLFPFEKDFYAKRGYAADFAGHPLIDEVHADKNAHNFLSALGLSDKPKTLALLPGSREKEISRHLPVMLKAAALLKKKHPKLQIILLQAKTINDEFLKKYSKAAPEGLKISKDYYNALNAADLCIVSSGTATLETGIMGKPMAVIYRTSWLTYLIARLVVRIPYISLVNIVAEKKVAEELIQHKASAGNIAKVIEGFLRDPEKMRLAQKELAGLKANLGTTGASHRAAKVVLSELAK